MTTVETKPKKKAGRTLLVSPDHTDEFNLTGLVNTHTTATGSRFLEFDTIENSMSAYDKLQEDNVRCKYSYYRVFFRLKDVDLPNAEYDKLKDSIKAMIAKLDNVTILFFKFFTKDQNLMGSGDLTVDTKSGLDALIANQDLEIEEGQDGKISLYRFKMKHNDDQDDHENDGHGNRRGNRGPGRGNGGRGNRGRGNGEMSQNVAGHNI